MAQTDFAAF